MADNESLMIRDDYINLKEGLGRVRDNKKLYRKMLGFFMESGEFTALEDSLVQKDFGKAADVAHAIKGMTGNLGFTELFKLSTKMMEELRHDQDAGETVAAFWAAYNQTKIYVEEIMVEFADQ
ncbi:MAG: Hpt domain-containing protein [Peptococcaceae bacterium]|jgi:HPt (histidine-containing phosphotransfer) domain-containing protein|nr:Hpt domain-containing protein [Peptococcaceae bacterium]